MRLAIIGSAGRKDDARFVTRNLYDEMYRRVEEYVRRWQITSAVSGGAAFADHLAVRAYLSGLVDELHLFLPAHFKEAFIPNPRVRFNPGDTANKLHCNFTRLAGVDGISELRMAIEKGAKVDVIEGFHNRNCEVASNCDYLLAFTFGTRTTNEITSNHPEFNSADFAGLKDGGTAHTYGEAWNLEAKAHINLFDIR